MGKTFEVPIKICLVEDPASEDPGPDIDRPLKILRFLKRTFEDLDYDTH